MVAQQAHSNRQLRARKHGARLEERRRLRSRLPVVHGAAREMGRPAEDSHDVSAVLQRAEGLRQRGRLHLRLGMQLLRAGDCADSDSDADCDARSDLGATLLGAGARTDSDADADCDACSDLGATLLGADACTDSNADADGDVRSDLGAASAGPVVERGGRRRASVPRRERQRQLRCLLPDLPAGLLRRLQGAVLAGATVPGHRVLLDWPVRGVDPAGWHQSHQAATRIHLSAL
mmetsp:Transcript_19449/g.61175  ORF Transcript_19449/g.61175 Transcript_19449/m.61175 type:complete len:234 (+) Transcript_19449:509-1210(+)